MQYTRPRTSCKICPLRDHKRVYSELVASERAPLLAVVGEAPGREEDRDGKPFTGPSGKLLNWALHEAGVARNNVYIANALCCRPTDGAIDSLEASEALGYCRAGLYDELAAQYDRGLRAVVALGQTAMHALGLNGKVGTYRGSLLETTLPGNRVLTVIPTYHPSMVLRQNWKRSSGGNAKGAVEWLADWKKAARIAREAQAGKERVVLAERFNLDPSVADIEAFVENACASDALVAVDIETSGLSYDDCRIVVVGLATSTEDALCVPFLHENAAPHYTNGSWERVKNALKRLFTTCPQVYQNSYFDVPRLRAFGFPIPYRLIKHDTMILHHCIAAEAPHDLGYIVSVYGQTPYWKEDFKNRAGSIFDMDQIEMRRYNLRDCVVLHQVLEPMLRDLHELDLEDVYYHEAVPLIEPVMEMTQYGIGIDMGRVKRYKARLEKLVEDGTRELYALGGLPPEFNVASTSQMRWFLYNEPLTAFARIDERDVKNAAKRQTETAKLDELNERIANAEVSLANARACARPAKALEKRLASARSALEKRLANATKPQSQIERDIEALRVVRDTVRPLYTLASYTPLQTDSGLLATDKEGLLSYKIALTNRRADVLAFKLKDGTDELAAIDRLLAFIDLLGKVSLYRKLISTYTTFYPWNDGRVHPAWKQHGTASGRLSCVAPNLQNAPKPHEDPNDIRNAIRGFFVARPGWKFISADYVNLEAQLLAYSTLDPELVDVFTHGHNLHDVNTRALFGVEKSSPEWDSCRKAAKIDFFANKCYGGSDYRIYQKIMLEVPDLRMTFSEYSAANKRWFATHPRYTEWAARVRNEARQRRQVRTPLGRLRCFLDNDRDIEREALNHMIQSSGASLVNRAMIRIERRLRAASMRTRFVSQVHDELILEAPDDEVATARDMLVEEMSREFDFMGYKRSIPVEAAIGPDLGQI